MSVLGKSDQRARCTISEYGRHTEKRKQQSSIIWSPLVVRLVYVVSVRSVIGNIAWHRRVKSAKVSAIRCYSTYCTAQRIPQHRERTLLHGLDDDMANAKVQLNRLMAVHYQHPNLDAVERFLVDFGLFVVKREETRTYYRGFGPETYVYIAEQSPDERKHFVGGILAVESADDLHRAAQVLGSSSIEDAHSLSGGKQVVLTDPVGMKVTLVHGAKMRPAFEVNEEVPGPILINSGTVRSRETLLSLERGPSRVAKCGHYGLRVDSSKFDEAVDWYMDTFNLKLSSCLQLANGKPAFMFLHIDKGKEFVDHHVREIMHNSHPSHIC